MNLSIKRHGSPEPLPESISLRAGDLSMIYEEGFLRYIKHGQTEILRLINHYARDKNWANVPMKILTQEIDVNARSFSISYTAECRNDEVHFVWNCQINGKEDSSLIFKIDGEALQSFLRNRLGFTVLHAAESVAGMLCTITHEDDTTEELRFPGLVSPHQPFVDIKAMKWKPAPGVEAELVFDGDLFETEDQRNWLDATFKTYCTPLTKPLPFRVRKGDTVHQAIHFNVKGHDTPSPSAEQAVSFFVDKIRVSTLPKIGIPLSELSHDESIISLIKELRPDFIRVVVHSVKTDILRSVMERGIEFGLPIEVALFVDDELDTNIVEGIRPYADHIQAIILLPDYRKTTDAELINAFVPALRHHFPNAKIGGGTDGFFTELNRERTPAHDLDFLIFSVNPEAHANDLRTVVENLSAHKDVVNTCREFAGGKEIHVGPVTFKTRSKQLPSEPELRHRSLFGAGWTIASIKQFAEAEVSEVSYFQTCGWSGILGHPEKSWPGIRDEGTTAYPLFIALREVLRHRHQPVTRFVTSDPLRMDGIAFLGTDDKQHILLANFTNSLLHVTLPYATAWRVRSIDENTIDGILANPLVGIEGGEEVAEGIHVLPFGIALLDEK